MTAAHHPLCGERLAVEGRRKVGGVPCLIVRLPDGTPGTVEVSGDERGLGRRRARRRGRCCRSRGCVGCGGCWRRGRPGGEGSGT